MSRFEENMKRLEPELNRAIQRRNIDKDRNGYPITLANGNPPTAEEVKKIVDRAVNGNGGAMKCSDGSCIRDGLRGEEEHLADTIRRKNKNPNAGVEEVRRYEVIDTRVVTWDDSIAQSKRSIADSKQYIADVELAGEWYGYWLQVEKSKSRESSIAMRVAVGAPAPRDHVKQDMAVRTVVRGPNPKEDVVKVAEILTNDKLGQEDKIKEIAKIKDMTTESAMILVKSWYDAGRNEKEWEPNALYGFIQNRLISMGRDKIAMKKTAGLSVYDLDWIINIFKEKSSELSIEDTVSEIMKLRKIPQRLAEGLVRKWEDGHMWNKTMSQRDFYNWILGAVGMPMRTATTEKTMNKTSGGGISPERLYGMIRNSLLSEMRKISQKFSDVNLKYRDRALTGTVDGHAVSLSYEILRASNGETAGMPILNVDGKRYDRFHGAITDKLNEAIGMGQVMASELEKIASEVTAAGLVPTKEEVKALMYKPTNDFFFERKSDGLYITFDRAGDAHTSFSNQLYGHFNVESVSRVGDRETKYRITRKTTARDKTADSRAISDVVSVAKKTLGVLDGLRREVTRIVGEAKREGIEGVEESLWACLEEMRGAGEALSEAIYQGNKQMSDREMRWLR